MDGLSQDQIASMGTFTPSRTECMDLAFEGATDSWKPDISANKLSHPSSGEHMSFSPILEAPGPRMKPAMNPNARQNTAPVLSYDSHVDERLEGITRHLKAIGFESFDDAVKAYYTNNVTGPPANEQPLSKFRRLAKVICDVFQTMNCAQWERHDCHEEIFRITQAMITSEASASGDALVSQLGSLIETQEFQILANKAEPLQSMKRTLQQEVSKLSGDTNRLQGHANP
jgi:hypothetical protein